ncbi:hypothetical protein [Deinococcus soli (ex Cha et al. 2016)]|uniref:Uncharacterized protein n=1 Tax=Deinococcus soli (ex Cha et al. 2016) TaxID=1309411 RepID=A0ACC6KN27_9DEIO|nr:hypothetical protein [Deinococcus soli (ex Cha et al. 2016)]MDR6753811.1 hypothetical protein [Deinococcus soli (ex Cha et al. 2016)]
MRIVTPPAAPAGPTAFRGALVRLVSNTAVPHAADTPIAWGTAVYDTDGIWSAAVPTRLVVPAGVSRVRITGFVSLQDLGAGTPGIRVCVIKKNGARFPGGQELLMAGQPFLLPADTAAVPVVPGDYFEVCVYQNSGGSVSTDNVNYPMHASLQVIA